MVLFESKMYLIDPWFEHFVFSDCEIIMNNMGHFKKQSLAGVCQSPEVGL